MALQEGTYTWEYGNTNQALWFTASYNTVTNQWTVDMKNGSMDLNALWWSNGDSNADGNIVLSKADNSIPVNKIACQISRTTPLFRTEYGFSKLFSSQYPLRHSIQTSIKTGPQNGMASDAVCSA